MSHPLVPPRETKKKYWEACKNDFLTKYNVPGQKNAATVLSAPKLTKYMTFEKIQKCSFLHWKCGFGPPPVGMTSTPGGDDLGPNTISSVGRRRKASIFRRRTFKNMLKNILNVTRTLFCLLKASPEHYFVIRAPLYCTFHVSWFFLDVPGTLPADTPYGSIFLSRCAGARKRHETSGHIFHHILYYRIRIFITKRSRAWIHNAGMRGDV